MSTMSRTDAETIRFFNGELDEMASKEASKRLKADGEVSALVFGRNINELAVQMAKSGVKVVFDAAAEDPPPATPGLRAMPLSQLALDMLSEAPFDLIVGQLALHSLTYIEARDVLQEMRRVLKIGGKLYLSAYGKHSTLGDNYPDNGKRVEERFAELPAPLAKLYNLHGPICLYSERDLINLLFEVGAPVLHSATSGQGNVRVIAVRI